MRLKSVPCWTAIVLAALPCPTGCTPSGSGAADAASDYIGGPVCTFDDSEDHTNTTALTLGEASVGHMLCPTKDQDWFTFTTGPNDHLVTIVVAVDGDLSPVQPSYAIWSVADGAPDVVTASPPTDLIGQNLEVTHCMDPGTYLVNVRDHNDDGQDLRRTYSVSVTSEPNPDATEPNDGPQTAATMVAGQAVTGTIACRGDDDYYRLDVPAGTLLRIRFDVPQAGFEPSLRITTEAGDVVVNEVNLSGSVAATSLDRYAVVPGAGVYYVIVGDDDGLEADPDTPYDLNIEFLADSDPNEPNPTPTLATELSATAAPCQGLAWGQWHTATGTIGAAGDVDYFVLPTGGCGSASGALLEAELVFDTNAMSSARQRELASEVQASLAIVREDNQTQCTLDADCQVLNRPCDDNWDCAGFFNNCLPQGLCAGASVCLPNGNCGANRIERHFQPPADTSGTPPPNEARLTAPSSSGEAIFLRVSDFQSDGAAPDTSYTLRVRLRADSDVNEPNNLFTPILADALQGAGAHLGQAQPIPVWGCDTGECCDQPDRWTVGQIGYDTDLDWFSYQHPCPGLDCMVRVHLEFDAGPVDPVATIFRSNGSPWFDLGVDEAPTQAAGALALGGLSAGDRCFYAYAGHTGEPYTYFLMVNDRLEVTESDPDQEYRLCVEKLADGCQAPCELVPTSDPAVTECTSP